MGLIKTKKTVESPSNPAATAEKAEPLKKASAKRERLNQFAETLKPVVVEDTSPKEALDFVKLPLSAIHFDGRNARTRHLQLSRPTENPLPEDHPEFSLVKQTIESIMELSEHLKLEPLHQEYALYRDRGRYYVAFGHRRHLALLIAFGPNHTRNFRVYPSKPANLSMTRWVENAARENVPLLQRLVDFAAALDEVGQGRELSNNALAAEFGLNKATFSILRRSVESETILSAVQEGMVERQEQLASLVKQDPSSLDEVAKILEQPRAPKPVEPPPTASQENSRGRPKVSIRFKPIKNTEVFRELINGGLIKFGWTEEDFSSMEKLQEKLDACLMALEDEMAKRAK